jgi:hypothetical protein
LAGAQPPRRRRQIRHAAGLPWTLARRLNAIGTDAASVTPTFEQAADALRTLGIAAASKLSNFIDSVDTSKIGISDAVALSKIMIDSIAAAAALGEKVLSRLWLDREKALAALRADEADWATD